MLVESLSLKGEDMNKFGDYRDCRQFQGSKKKRRRVEFAQREEKRAWIRVKAEALSAAQASDSIHARWEMEA